MPEATNPAPAPTRTYTNSVPSRGYETWARHATNKNRTLMPCVCNPVYNKCKLEKKQNLPILMGNIDLNSGVSRSGHKHGCGNMRHQEQGSQSDRRWANDADSQTRLSSEPPAIQHVGSRGWTPHTSYPEGMPFGRAITSWFGNGFKHIFRQCCCDEQRITL
jgi:hypothetical protein